MTSVKCAVFMFILDRGNEVLLLIVIIVINSKLNIESLDIKVQQYFLHVLRILDFWLLLQVHFVHAFLQKYNCASLLK